MTNLQITEGDDDTFPLTIDRTEVDFTRFGGTTSIILSETASSVDDFYNDLVLTITKGTGIGQSRIISDYIGSTKVATVETWNTIPDITSKYSIAKIPVDITGYTVLFTVKKKITDDEVDAIIQKDVTSHTNPTQGETTIPVVRLDTLGVKPGFYPYDIKICDLSGDRTTIISGLFQIKQSVGDREC